MIKTEGLAKAVCVAQGAAFTTFTNCAVEIDKDSNMLQLAMNAMEEKSATDWPENLRGPVYTFPLECCAIVWAD